MSIEAKIALALITGFVMGALFWEWVRIRPGDGF